MPKGPSSAELDLTDTKTAFSHLSNAQLRQAYWLFRIIGQPLVVQMGPSLADLSLKFKLPVKGLIRKTVFSHFCGGESIEACLPRIEELARWKVGTILDFAREGGGRESDFEAVADEIIRTIDMAAKHRSIPFAVFKPSAIASLELLTKKDRKLPLTPDETKAWERFQARFHKICQYAFDQQVRIMVDAEESWIQDTVDALAEAEMRLYNRKTAIVFNTVQLYRHDRLEYLQRALSDAEKHAYILGVKLVRGAYLEKENKAAAAEGRPSPLNASKEATDKMYNTALKFCVENLARMALVAGTHNEDSVLKLTALMRAHKIAPQDPRIHFAQLLGMSDHISYNLAAAGYNVAKYVPYGTVAELLPYLTRRAQENSSVAGQSSRELRLLQEEMQNRHI